MNLSNKKIYIAPHTPKSTMFAKVFKENFSDIEFLGFIDKEKKGDNIYQVKEISKNDFDFIFIYSPNHFDTIYNHYKKIINPKKLIHVDTINNCYIFNDYMKILKNRIKAFPSFVKLKFLQYSVYFFNIFPSLRDEVVFVSKDFVGTNNKMLLIEFIKSKNNTLILTDNLLHLKELKYHGIQTLFLGSLYSYYKLAKAKIVIQDQGNSNTLIQKLNYQQQKIQLWHGIPLKRMNKLTDILYDYHISTSDFVNQTSLSEVIQAKQHLNLGYPRNDLLLKKHSSLDLLFVDLKIYNFVKNNKTIVYMPTHRESQPSFGQTSAKELPLNLISFNQFLKENNLFFILKLHPFVSNLYDTQYFSHIIFYKSQQDIYPILKYTDILITDYSSVYFDFLLLGRPIIFFDYDYKEYSSNIDGFVYDYEENAPGNKVTTQNSLEKEIIDLFMGEDLYKDERKKVLELFFKYKDHKSSHRITDKILQQTIT